VAEPRLIVIGVYRPQISAETWREQWKVAADEDATREHFDKLVLIEAIVEGLAGPFDMSKFGQMRADLPNDPQHMQVGYDEGLSPWTARRSFSGSWAACMEPVHYASQPICTYMIQNALCFGRTAK
jgi:hypothetical protein